MDMTLKRMRTNARKEGWPVWKNIPLARKRLEKLPKMAPADIVAFVDAVFDEELLNTRDVPRLCLSLLHCRKRALEEMGQAEESKPELQRRLERFIDPEVDLSEWMKESGTLLRFDPVERTSLWEENIYAVEAECERRLKGKMRGMGFCFAYWAVKRTVLSGYGIEWNSPSRMNPRVIFD